MMRIIAATILAVFFVSPARADGCDKFAWSLARERTLLAATGKPVLKAGDTLATVPAAAFTLRLQPGAEAAFVMPPERKPKGEQWHGGIIKFPGMPKAGIYQITLSDDAWVDVLQNDRYARSVGSTGRSDCPGLRKSLRIDLGTWPFVLQISGVSADSIAVTIGARD